MKDFILYPEALELKQLGFDEPCFGAFIDKEFKFFDFSNDLNGYVNDKNLIIGAPTYSQAFRWFREKYNLHQFIEYIEVAERYDWWVRHYMRHTKTYEEAELACLRRLIKLVKENQK